MSDQQAADAATQISTPPVTEAQPAAAPQAAQDTPQQTAGGGDEQETKPESPKTFTQEDVDRIVQKRLSKEQRKWQETERQFQERVNREVEAALQRAGHTRQQPGEQDPEPKAESYDSYEKYLSEKARWDARQEYRIQRQREIQQAQQQQQYQTAMQLQDSWRQKIDAASKKFDDFEEVTFSSQAPVSQPMNAAILASDVGPEIVYYLAKNPAEAARISQIPNALKQIAAIGQIEAKLTAQAAAPAPQQTKAPDPIKPVSGKGASDDTPSAADSYEQWLKKRNKQLGRG